MVGDVSMSLLGWSTNVIRRTAPGVTAGLAAANTVATSTPFHGGTVAPETEARRSVADEGMSVVAVGPDWAKNSTQESLGVVVAQSKKCHTGAVPVGQDAV
jgi:hypothetical protein